MCCIISVNKGRTTNKGVFLSSVGRALMEGESLHPEGLSGAQKHHSDFFPLPKLSMLCGCGGCISGYASLIETWVPCGCVIWEMKLVIQLSSHHTRLLTLSGSTPYASFQVSRAQLPRLLLSYDTIGDEHPCLVHAHLHQVQFYISQ